MSEWVRTYENGADYIESLDGVDWNDAPLPRRWHDCTAQTRGWMSLNYVERCACGAIRDSTREPWMEKNQTRHGRARARRDERAPKETVTCGSCGNDYEAVAGSPIAAARQCATCWGDDLVRTHGR
jgi:hypothetical protein